MAKSALAKYSGPMILRGIAAILFAILVLFWTKDALNFLIILFGIFVFIEGIISIFGAFGAKKEHDDWWMHLARGILEILLGIMTLLWPNVTVVILVYFIAFWAIFMGIFELWLSSKILKEVAGRSVLKMIGVLSLILGLVFIFFPYSSLITIVWLIGIFALISGIGFIIFGTEIKRLK